jgi:hypothetical protein
MRGKYKINLFLDTAQFLMYTITIGGCAEGVHRQAQKVGAEGGRRRWASKAGVKYGRREAGVGTIYARRVI